MNFYKRFPADYGRKTARLTLAQHGAYTLLLDEIYSTEAGLPADMDSLYRICRAMNKPEQEAVRVVVDAHFPVHTDGLRWNPRAVLEIELMHKEQEKARAFWRSIPQERRTEMSARRRAAELNAVPAWLTGSDLAEISIIYQAARQMTLATGVPHEVDHIIPLQGKTVQGLHVPWNLRVVTATANRAKGVCHG